MRQRFRAVDVGIMAEVVEFLSNIRELILGAADVGGAPVQARSTFQPVQPRIITAAGGPSSFAGLATRSKKGTKQRQQHKSTNYIKYPLI